MPKDTGEFIISKSMNLRLPPIFGYTAFLFIPRQVRFRGSDIRISEDALYCHAVRHASSYFKMSDCKIFFVRDKLHTFQNISILRNLIVVFVCFFLLKCVIFTFALACWCAFIM